jgi:hypothetical protein
MTARGKSVKAAAAVPPASPGGCPARESIAAVTPTVCSLMGIPPVPGEKPIARVLEAAWETFSEGSAERCLVFAPDALGSHLGGEEGLFDRVRRAAPLEVPARAVFPPKTPVCFASMFTGLPPEEHGIRRYEKPVLACGTLFDRLAAAGRRVAVVSVAECSIDVIFRGRPVLYFSEEYDPGVVRRTVSLLEEDRADFILAYVQGYDDALHRTTSFSPEALAAARENVSQFLETAEAFDRCWSRFNRALLFAPDHGAHTSPTTLRGDHGEDIPEDMELSHFYGFRGAGG